MWRWFVLVLAIVSAGCRSGTLPDPNDPIDVGTVSPEILQRNLRAISDALLERRLKREITNDEYRELMAKAANDLLKELNLTSVDRSQAWRYAEVMRTARNWEAAERLLKISVQHATEVHDEDRRINDTLRLAQVQAAQGRVEEAMKTVGQVMNARPVDSAPILPAVYFELLPFIRGKGFDYEAAQLLEAACAKHLLTQVAPDTAAGHDFLVAKPHHLRNAFFTAGLLYESSGKAEDAAVARRRAEMANEDLDELTRWASEAPHAVPFQGAPQEDQSHLLGFLRTG